MVKCAEHKFRLAGESGAYFFSLPYRRAILAAFPDAAADQVDPQEAEQHGCLARISAYDFALFDTLVSPMLCHVFWAFHLLSGMCMS